MKQDEYDRGHTKQDQHALGESSTYVEQHGSASVLTQQLDQIEPSAAQITLPTASSFLRSELGQMRKAGYFQLARVMTVHSSPRGAKSSCVFMAHRSGSL